MADPIVNFFKSTLVGTYSDTDTEFTIETGDGALLPDPAVDGAYNLVIYEGSAGIVAQAYEIVRVTGKSGDVLTVQREQEGTTALSIGASLHSIIMSATKKTFDDLANISDQSLKTTDNVTFNGVTATSSFRFPFLNGEPESPQQGQLFYNTKTSEIVFYDGTNFQALTYTLASKIAEALPAGVTADANNMTVSISDDLLQDTNTTATALDGSLIAVGTLDLDLIIAQAQAGALDGVAEIIIPDLLVEYLVVAGGGPGGNSAGGAGGGAGGYRSSVSGESSGGGASAETANILCSGTSYCVTVGAGGSGINGKGSNGSNSIFSTITSTGGGAGGAGDNDTACPPGNSGGSGGGGSAYLDPDSGAPGGSGTSGQGYSGGSGAIGSGGSGEIGAGGGGGAGQSGFNGSTCVGGNGGNGVQSCITGSNIYRAGGGGGYGSGSYTSGGLGGGGYVGISGTANTGGGGGGCQYNTAPNGGSGIVILRYPQDYLMIPDAGLTSSTSTVGNNKVSCFTAGTGNVQFYLESEILQIEYIVIGGGGGGQGTNTYHTTGGGGAGGYRSSIDGECSGGLCPAESKAIVMPSTAYCVSIGAGGGNGTCSIFNSIISAGGGSGGSVGGNGYNGGSGGGGGGRYPTGGVGGSSCVGQGFNGGSSNSFDGGAGGGAGAIGGNGGGNLGGTGGIGIESCVDGVSTYRAGGGGGGSRNKYSWAGLGGSGGGGRGGYCFSAPSSGTANTGGGGGGTGQYSGNSTIPGSSGGSGIVILRYDSGLTLSADVGLTTSTSTVGSCKVTCITAGTGNICFN